MFYVHNLHKRFKNPSSVVTYLDHVRFPKLGLLNNYNLSQISWSSIDICHVTSTCFPSSREAGFVDTGALQGN